jgi:hypothetical protein
MICASSRPDVSILNNRDTEPEWGVMQEVLGYFFRNPKAVDTLEGIARWRLKDQAIRHSVVQTDKALRWLVVHRFLEETSGPGLAPVFKLASDRIDAARDFLEQPIHPSSRHGFKRSPHN